MSTICWLVMRSHLLESTVGESTIRQYKGGANRSPDAARRKVCRFVRWALPTDRSEAGGQCPPYGIQAMETCSWVGSSMGFSMVPDLGLRICFQVSEACTLISSAASRTLSTLPRRIG